MIFKLAHLTFCVSSIEEVATDLLSLGFGQHFYDKEAKNPKIKKDLMRDYVELHDLVLFSKNQWPSIELVRYHKFIQQQRHSALLQDIFVNEEDFFDEAIDKNFFSIGENSTSKHLVRVSKNSCILQTRNIEQSKIFWGGLGFKVVKQQSLQVIMCFNSIVQVGSFFLILQENQDVPITENKWLDDSGAFVCAFLSTSLELDIKRLLSLGFVTATEIEKFFINGKWLQIAFIRGCQNEFVELISM